jgi:hypothetical protein
MDLVVFDWTDFSVLLLHLLFFLPKQIFTGKLPVLRYEKTGFYRPHYQALYVE